MTFGSEFFALLIYKELIVALRSKLWVFGIQIEGPVDVVDLFSSKSVLG